MVRRRFTILSASMGAGHQSVAAELSRRLAALGHHTQTMDVLQLLPVRLGSPLRWSYGAAVQYAPWLYEAVYHAFLAPGPHVRTSTSPLVVPAAAALQRRLADSRPDTVICTFHLAAQMSGRLRQRGILRAPAIVVVTDFAAHRQWFHPGNDLHLCPTRQSATALRRMGAGRAFAVGPVVPEAFLRADQQRTGPANPYLPDFSRRAPGRPPVLVSSGAWGVGSQLERTAALLASSGYLPVVLCGHNRSLRHRLTALPGVLALGWITDVPEVMAASRVLVENAAGQTAAQALAAGLPVVSYRPIAGHGTDGARQMAAAGLASFVRDPWDLVRVLDELTDDSPLRRARITAGQALFTADAAQCAAEAGLPVGR